MLRSRRDRKASPLRRLSFLCALPRVANGMTLEIGVTGVSSPQVGGREDIPSAMYIAFLFLSIFSGFFLMRSKADVLWRATGI